MPHLSPTDRPPNDFVTYGFGMAAKGDQALDAALVGA
jgi:hypothetical protein